MRQNLKFNTKHKYFLNMKGLEATYLMHSAAPSSCEHFEHLSIMCAIIRSRIIENRLQFCTPTSFFSHEKTWKI